MLMNDNTVIVINCYMIIHLPSAGYPAEGFIHKYMKKTFSLGVFVLLSIFCFSCKTNSPGTMTLFPASQEVHAEHIRLNEILKINEIYRTEDYVILQNGSEGVRDFFFVYSYPEMTFLYSFGGRGRGPGEYLMPSVIRNTPNNTFAFRDHGKNLIASYLLTDSLALQAEETQMKQRTPNSYWEINYLADSLYLLKNIGMKWSRLELRSLPSDIGVDSVPNTFNLRDKLKDDYFPDYDDYYVASNGRNFALGYFFADRIEFGKVENNKIIKTVRHGVDKFPDLHPFDRGVVLENPTIYKNMVYFDRMIAGEQYVYASYYGRKYGDLRDAEISTIEIYNWEGDPVALLKLDEKVTGFFVDESTCTIYGVNYNQSVDEIMKFTFSL